MIDTFNKTITVTFEGYKFEAFVEFGFENRAIKLVDVVVSNQSPPNINMQDFYHHINILRKKILDGEFDEQIKYTISNSINHNCVCKYTNLMSIVAIVIGAVLALLITTTLL